MSHPRAYASVAPHKPAVIVAETGEILSYGDLERAANKGAHFLRRLGLQSGDTIALWLPNIPAYFTLYWAAQRAGLYIAPVATALTAEEAAYILSDSGAKLLVTHAAVKSATELLAGHLPPSVAHVYQAGPGLDFIGDWNTAIAAEPDTPIPDETPGFHMVYSSGTTGRPKGSRSPRARRPLPIPSPSACAPPMAWERPVSTFLQRRSTIPRPSPSRHPATALAPPW